MTSMRIDDDFKEEVMYDRYYFSDWGGCTCPEDDVDPECPYWESGDHNEEEEDE